MGAPIFFRPNFPIEFLCRSARMSTAHSRAGLFGSHKTSSPIETVDPRRPLCPRRRIMSIAIPIVIFVLWALAIAAIVRYRRPNGKLGRK
jgi:hypothetical protein